MTTESSRPLHLHTLDSLCADLVAGLSVGVGDDGSTFRLQSSASRGILFWYGRNRQKWAANVQTVDVEAIQLLDEGIAQRSSDIDLVWINGYGFPA